MIYLRQPVALIWLAALPALLLVSPTGAQQGNVCEQCTVVDGACLTTLALAAQQNPGLLTSFKNVSSAVLSCVGTQSAVVRPLRILMPNYAEALVSKFKSLLALTIGWEIDVHYAPSEQVGAQILDTEATGRAFYDGWVTDTFWTLELAQQGMIEPLDNYVNADPQIEWLDVSRFIRTSSAVFNGSVVGVPVGGSMYLMHWRRDVFNRAGLMPPQTWRDAIAVAKALNGTDFNGDGQPEHTLCLDIFESDFTYLQTGNSTGNSELAGNNAALLSQILASMTQTQGPESGWLFSPDTMQTFIDSPATTEALAIVRDLLPYTQRWTQYETDLSRHPFVRGDCALHFAKAELWKATQLLGRFSGQFASAPLPGSDVVLDRNTGQLIECSATQCPFATWVNTSSQSVVATGGGGGQAPPVPRLVNRASYSPYSSVLGMINANSLGIYKAAVYRGLALFSSYAFALQATLAQGLVAPSRGRLLSQTNASLAFWTRSGYNRSDVSSYLSAMQSTLNHPNNALDLRIQHGPAYRDVLYRATQNMTNGQDVASVQSFMSQGFAAITARSPLQQLGDGYLAGLNVRRSFVLPVFPPPPSPPATTPAPSGADGLSSDQKLAIIIGSVMGGVLLGCLLMGLLVARNRTHRRWGFFGTQLPPGVSAGTTLVVTDIENSTLLWEEIPQDVMNVALELHHTLVRKLLIRHQGYESATEGDSFIAAFHTPLDALQFTQAFQAGLLSLSWPAEVLACRLSCPVWVKPAIGYKKPDSSIKAGLSQPMSNGGLGRQYSVFRSTAPADSSPPWRFHTSAGLEPASSSTLTNGTASVLTNGTASSALMHVTSLSNGTASAPSMHVTSSVLTNVTSMPSTSAHSHVLSQQQQQQQHQQEQHSSHAHALPQQQQQSSATVGSQFLPPQQQQQQQQEQHPSASAGSQFLPLPPLPLPPPPRQQQQQQQPFKPQDALSEMKDEWAQCPAPAPGEDPAIQDKHLAFRGLRVRVGLHSGLDNPRDAVLNATTGRMEYSGRLLYTAKAVADSGHGGMVLISHACFSIIPSASLQAMGAVLNMGEYAFTKGGGSGVVKRGALYQVVASDMRPRLAVMEHRLRSVMQLQVGVLQAPVTHACIAFANVVGAAALLAWDSEVAGRALEVFQRNAVELLLAPGAGILPYHYGSAGGGTGPWGDGEEEEEGGSQPQPPGYVVELAGGLCLAAFQTPVSAVLWALRLTQDLLWADWDRELLAHELCEEVRVGGSGPSHIRRSMNRRPSADPLGIAQGSSVRGASSRRPSADPLGLAQGNTTSVRRPSADPLGLVNGSTGVRRGSGRRPSADPLGLVDRGVGVRKASGRRPSMDPSGVVNGSGVRKANVRRLSADPLGLVNRGVSGRKASVRRPSTDPLGLVNGAGTDSRHVSGQRRPSADPVGLVEGSSVGGVARSLGRHHSTDPLGLVEGSSVGGVARSLGRHHSTDPLGLVEGSSVGGVARSLGRHHSTDPLGLVEGSSVARSFGHRTSIDPLGLVEGVATPLSSVPRVTFAGLGQDRTSPHLNRMANRGGLLLFRGPRLKIGVDMGSVHANINPCTGRMAYRGRVMNRCARIADKAGSGQVWCSRAVIDAFEATAGVDSLVEVHPLGSFNLKGVTEPVDLMQCVLLQDTSADMYADLMDGGEGLRLVNSIALPPGQQEEEEEEGRRVSQS